MEPPECAPVGLGLRGQAGVMLTALSRQTAPTCPGLRPSFSLLIRSAMAPGALLLLGGPAQRGAERGAESAQGLWERWAE